MGQNNYGHYNNKSVNKAMTALLSQPDAAKQNELLLGHREEPWSRTPSARCCSSSRTSSGTTRTKVTGVSSTLRCRPSVHLGRLGVEARRLIRTRCAREPLNG